MFDILKEKTAIGIIATIILGAIGSGLWDIAIKPFFKLSGRYILKFYTFGLEKFRNPIYQQISHGKIDISTSIYSMVIFSFMTFPILLTFIYVSPIKRELVKQNNNLLIKLEKITNYHEERSKYKNTLLNNILGFNELNELNEQYYKEIDRNLKHFYEIVNKYDNTKKQLPFSKEDMEELIDIQSKIRRATSGVEESWEKMIFRIMFIFFLLSLFAGFFFLYPVIRNTYINDSISYFEELITICKPYIEQEKYDLFMSRFAQIKTKEDYLRIIDELKEIAENNKAIIRDFNIL